MTHGKLILIAILVAGLPTLSMASADANALAQCTADRLAKFTGPLGIEQPWPQIAAIPADAQLSAPVALANAKDQLVSDGYVVTLQVDPVTLHTYVIQRGGFGGTQTIFGPLPVAACYSAGGS